MFLDRIEQKLFRDRILDTLDDSHGRVVPVGKTFIRSLSHERPFFLVKVPFALDNLLVVLLEALCDLHLTQRLLTTTDV